MSSLMACIAGMALDAIFGDPVWLYHPVRIIGNWISILEKWLRVFCKNDEKKERILSLAGEKRKRFSFSN